MGRILFASTFGAIFGPSLVIPAEHAGMALGLQKYSGPWLFSAVLFTCAMVNVAVRLRPDPLLVLQAEVGTVDVDRPVRLACRWRRSGRPPVPGSGWSRWSSPSSSWSGLMAMAPVVMRTHHHETLGPFVLSVHLVGMYAVSPLVGRYADRFGRRVTLRTGALVMIVASVLALFAADDVPVMFVSMALLGVGSTMGLIGGSTLLSESVPVDVRVPVQGTADLITAVAGGLAGVVAGLVLSRLGFGLLGVVGARS